ncbi:MAG: hypothetical protein HC818_02960 [Synechococcaceae cyanobacterium RM1_1_27]|nr:hypothetical protein [Synechococcaceae cyanobacterium RM1_1_27]
MGQDYQMAKWVALVDVVEEILAQPTCSMATVALPILRNLKQAHQALVAGSWDQIQPSPDLVALRPEPIVEVEPDIVEPDIFEELVTLGGDEDSLVEHEIGLEADATAAWGDLGSDSVLPPVDEVVELDSTADADAMTDLFDTVSVSHQSHQG